MPDEAVCIAMHPCPVGRKWIYRKRRSIHEATKPRETLIACSRLGICGIRRWSRHRAGFCSGAKLTDGGKCLSSVR